MTNSAPPDREAARRRLMFIPGEDFYFLGYTLLVTLEELDSKSPERALLDPLKMAYLADFIGSDQDLLLALSDAAPMRESLSRLTVLHDRAISRRAPLERLLTALAHAELISSQKTETGREAVYIRDDKRVTGLLAASLFDGERNRARRLRRKFSHIRLMTSATVRERLFAQKGVRTWAE